MCTTATAKRRRKQARFLRGRKPSKRGRVAILADHKVKRFGKR